MKQRKQMDPGTGILLSPGLHGEGCPGNGTEPGLECCCEECDWFLDCYPEWDTASDSGNIVDFGKSQRVIIE